MSFTVRPGVAADAPGLVLIEEDAAQIFRCAKGLEWLADQPGASVGVYLRLIDSGTVWVVEDASGTCGFVAARVEQPDLHLVEISVRRDHQRKGLARTLIQRAAEEARLFGCSALTLTTFRDLSWNEQLYAKLGFEALEERDLSERLRFHIDADAAGGLPRDRRCAMRLRL